MELFEINDANELEAALEAIAQGVSPADVLEKLRLEGEPESSVADRALAAVSKIIEDGIKEGTFSGMQVCDQAWSELFVRDLNRFSKLSDNFRKIGITQDDEMDAYVAQLAWALLGVLKFNKNAPRKKMYYLRLIRLIILDEMTPDEARKHIKGE
jgi:hypothetical protein